MARVFLSGNGVPGIILFSSLIAAAASSAAGSPLYSLPYILCLIVLPATVIFFQAPLRALLHFYSGDSIIHHSSHLAGSLRFSKLDGAVPSLFRAKHVYARFGRLPTESFEKLRIYTDEPFIVHPLKSGRDFIWCIYSMAEGHRRQVDAIFHDLFFERIYIPDGALENSEETESFIRKCIDGSDLPEPGRESEPHLRKNTVFGRMFPEGLGSFFSESFFEMFEVLLSFATNTMSFLRVGGFVLSHAGMMSVVMALSQAAGAGAAPAVVIFGNLFVMALEGLIVGIQVLRLEFYEMFSRFYEGGGLPFSPVSARTAR